MTFSSLSLSLITVSLAGVWVGTPVSGGAGATPQLILDEQSLPVSSLTLLDEAGQQVTTTLSADLLAPGVAFSLPPGEWVSLTLEPGAAALFEGYGVTGGTFDLDLDVGSLSLDFDPPLSVPAGQNPSASLVLAWDGWLSAALLGLDPGEHISVAPGHSLHNVLVDRLEVVCID